MLPAFNTRSGLPLAWVNLLKGEMRRDVRHTCTAGAGTLLLEFATLSRLTVSAEPHRYTNSRTTTVETIDLRREAMREHAREVALGESQSSRVCACYDSGRYSIYLPPYPFLHPSGDRVCGSNSTGRASRRLRKRRAWRWTSCSRSGRGCTYLATR